MGGMQDNQEPTSGTINWQQSLKLYSKAKERCARSEGTLWLKARKRYVAEELHMKRAVPRRLVYKNQNKHDAKQ